MPDHYGKGNVALVEEPPAVERQPFASGGYGRIRACRTLRQDGLGAKEKKKRKGDRCGTKEWFHSAPADSMPHLQCKF